MIAVVVVLPWVPATATPRLLRISSPSISDLRTIGSGNIGATNAMRAGGKPLGLLVFALDCLKGWAAVAWIATVYFRPDQFQKLMRRMVLERKPVFIRIVSACSGLVCLLLIWIAFKRL